MCFIQTPQILFPEYELYRWLLFPSCKGGPKGIAVWITRPTWHQKKSPTEALPNNAPAPAIVVPAVANCYWKDQRPKKSAPDRTNKKHTSWAQKNHEEGVQIIPVTQYKDIQKGRATHVPPFLNPRLETPTLQMFFWKWTIPRSSFCV